MEKYFYIYNPRQADFFIKAGLRVLGVGKGTQGEVYIKFLRDEISEQVFTLWVERKKHT